jgi:cell division protein FtsB
LRRRKFHRKITVLALCGVFAAGAATALFGKGGYLELQRLRHERETVRLEVERQQAAVVELQNEIHRLEHDPMARERIAREQLGFARPGEITFLLPSDGTGEGLIPQPDEGKQSEPIR